MLGGSDAALATRGYDEKRQLLCSEGILVQLLLQTSSESCARIFTDALKPTESVYVEIYVIWPTWPFLELTKVPSDGRHDEGAVAATWVCPLLGVGAEDLSMR